jgi:hypothetical protein
LILSSTRVISADTTSDWKDATLASAKLGGYSVRKECTVGEEGTPAEAGTGDDAGRGGGGIELRDCSDEDGVCGDGDPRPH